MSQKALVLRKVLPNKTIFLERVLPREGEILVEKGGTIEPFDVVGKCLVAKSEREVALGSLLGVGGARVAEHLQKKVGDIFTFGEVLASRPRWRGLVRKEFKAPFSGIVNGFEQRGGVLRISSTPVPFRLLAGLGGQVHDLYPKRAVLIKSRASLVPGVYSSGVGVPGEIAVLVKADQVLTADLLGRHLAGKIVVGGSLVTKEALGKASVLGVGGIVTGGVYGRDLNGVKITLLVTEGFGRIPMSGFVWNFLKSVEARHCYLSANSRHLAVPEVGVKPEESDAFATLNEDSVALREGMVVKILSWPYFGLEGRVTEMIDEPQLLRSGLRSPVVTVEIPQDSNSAKARSGNRSGGSGKKRLSEAKQVTVPALNIGVVVAP